MLASPKVFASRPWPDPLDRGSVGEWRFDRDTGLLLPDYSGYGYHGTLINGPVWQVTPQGVALDFDGTNDYVDCGTKVAFDGPCMLEVLVNLDSNSTINWIRGVFSKGFWGGDGNGDLRIILRAPTEVGVGRWRVDVTTSTGTTQVLDTVDAPVGELTHIIGGWDGVTCYLYRNAVLRNSGARSGVLAPSSNPLYVGAYPNNVNNTAMDGQVMLARAYNRGPSAAEVAKHYEIGMARRMQIGAPHLWRVLWGGGVAAAPPITVSMDALALTGTAQSTSLSMGAVAFAMDLLTLAGLAQGSSLSLGAVSLAMDLLTLIGMAEDSTLSLGAISLAMDKLTLSGAPLGASLSLGAISLALDALGLSGTAESTSLSLGAVSLGMDRLSLTATPEAATLVATTILAMDALDLTAAIPALTLQPGGVTIALDELALTILTLAFGVGVTGLRYTVTVADALIYAAAVSDASLYAAAVSDALVYAATASDAL